MKELFKKIAKWIIQPPHVDYEATGPKKWDWIKNDDTGNAGWYTGVICPQCAYGRVLWDGYNLYFCEGYDPEIPTLSFCDWHTSEPPEDFK